MKDIHRPQFQYGIDLGGMLLDAETAVPKRRPCKARYVEGSFTEDKNVWTKELQMQCEETADTQEWRIMKFKTEGDKQFTGDWRIAAITVDMVPIATIVAEMIKKIFFKQKSTKLQNAPDI